MNINDEYYKKISYKKNTYEDLKLYLKMYHRYKSVVFISTKSCPVFAMTAIVNAITYADCKFKHFCVSNGFNGDELKTIDEYISKTSCNVIIGLGGGTACDVCKFFAKKADCIYLFSPTMPSSLAYFTSYCVNPYDSTLNFYYKPPEKLYISETIIRSLTKQQFNACMQNFVAYNSVVNDLCILGDEDCEEKIEKLQKIYARANDELGSADDEENNLVLMDLFVDLGFELLGLNLNSLTLINFYSVAKRMNLNEGGIPLLPVCADVYCQICNKMIAQNDVDFCDVYNIQQNIKLFKKYKISQKDSKNLFFLQKKCEKSLNFNNFALKKTEIAKVFKATKTQVCKTIKTHQVQSLQNVSCNVDMFLNAFNLLLMFNPSNSYITKFQLAGKLNFV